MSNRYPKKLKNCNKCKMNNYNNTANLKICSSSTRKNCNNKNFKNNKKVNCKSSSNISHPNKCSNNCNCHLNNCNCNNKSCCGLWPLLFCTSFEQRLGETFRVYPLLRIRFTIVQMIYLLNSILLKSFIPLC